VRPGAALAAEADTVLRTFRGARPVEPCLRLLGGKGKAGSGHTKKTEVSSDTDPLRATTNRAYGEAPRASVPAGTTKVCPIAGFDTIPASGARGAEGTVRPGADTAT
jgi:hypothetical protein